MVLKKVIMAMPKGPDYRLRHIDDKLINTRLYSYRKS